VKNAGVILIGIALNVYIALGSVDILPIFLQPMSMECVPISLRHLEILWSLFYSFQSTGYSPLWLSIFLIFYWFWCSCKWDCFLNFTFCHFIISIIGMQQISVHWFLNPVTLQNLFIRSCSFLVDSLGFSMYSIMSSANRVLLLTNLDALYFFMLANCCDCNFQYSVE